MKYVLNLTTTEEKALNNLHKTSPKHQIRQMAHCIILSSRKYSVESLAVIFDVTQDTVNRWINIWNQKRLKSLNHINHNLKNRILKNRIFENDLIY
jgi:hypothetical protein